jgi:hypothetical protein
MVTIIIENGCTVGVFSWSDGFVPDSSEKARELRHVKMVLEAKKDPDALFDRLMREGKTAEAAWLVEHIDELGS